MIEQLIMVACALEVLACVATGPIALAFYARLRERRDFARARVIR